TYEREEDEKDRRMYKGVFGSLSGKESWDIASGDDIEGWRVLEERKDGRWQIRAFGKARGASCLEDVRERIKGRGTLHSLEVEKFWSTEQASAPKRSPFGERLVTILDNLIIPYDPAERKRQLPRAFEKLEKYLEKWKPENLTDWRLEQVKWSQGGIAPVG